MTTRSVALALCLAISVPGAANVAPAGAEGRLGKRQDATVQATEQSPAAPAKKPDTQDPDDVSRLRQKGEQGNAEAQFELGFLYFSGNKVVQNFAEAVKWWQKAADQGVAQAQLDLGVMYQNGIGVARDVAQAVQWYRKAADQGHPTAQSNLGFMYQNGQGVARDLGRAIRWWQMAAEQDNTTSQFNLSVAYHNGQGVMRDDVESYKWAQIAMTHSSGESHERYAHMLNDIAARMTPTQVADAQQRAREWLAVFDRRQK